MFRKGELMGDRLFALWISSVLFIVSLSFAQTPYLVKDIKPGADGALDNGYVNIPNTIVVNNILYFPADEGVHGIELWRSDGTEQGTWMVKDICPGSAGSRPMSLTEMNGRFYFRAEEDGKNYHLWTSDGTESGTSLVVSVSPSYITDVNGTLYFSHASQLWKSDGTPGGTTMIIDLFPNCGNCYIREIFNFHNEAYFNYVVSLQNSLWKSDGTKEGTIKIQDCGVYCPIEYKNEFFFGFRSVAVNALAKLNTSTDEIVIIKTFDSSPENPPAHLMRVRDNIFFIATTVSQGNELWKSNGTPEGTLLVKDIYPGPISGYSLEHYCITKLNGILYIGANDGTNGRELWRSDGTEEGTRMVKDIQPGFNNFSSPSLMTSITDMMYFICTTDDYGDELWQTDGTENGTKIVSDINRGSASALRLYIKNSDTVLFFNADDGIHGYELWALPLSPLQQITIQKLINHILGINPLPPDLLPYGDINGDGLIDSADVIQLSNMID